VIFLVFNKNIVNLMANILMTLFHPAQNTGFFILNYEII